MEKKLNSKTILAIVIVILFVAGFGCYFLNNLKQNLPQEDKDATLVAKETEKYQSIVSLDKTVIFTKDLADKVQVFEISSNSKNASLLFEINKIIPKDGSADLGFPTFKVSKNGVILYSIEDDYSGSSNLYIWKDKQIRKIGKYEDYTISPDGKYIIAEDSILKNCVSSTYPDMESGTIHQKFYKISIEDVNLTPSLFFEENNNPCIWVEGIEKYAIAGWSNEKDSKLLLQKDLREQLGGHKSDLFELDINGGKISKISSIENRTFMDIDQNNNILTRVEDTACCGGLNYSNDQTFVYNIKNKTETKIFDEYLTYGNKGKERTEQHNTEKAVFSPDGKYIAQMIQGFFSNEDMNNISETPPILLITDLFGKEVFKEEGLKFLGWFDSTKLLAKSDVTYLYHKTPIEGSYFTEKINGLILVNILTKEKTSILEGDFKDFWIVED